MRRRFAGQVGTGPMELFYRIKGLLFAPDAEWSLVARERADMGALFVYVAVLAAVPAVARFLGDFLVGVSTVNGTVLRVSLDAGLVGAAVDYAFAFVAVTAVALVVNLLAPRFGSKPNYPDALKVTAYSFTPYWIVSVCFVFPGLRFLSVLGLYGFFAAWTGLIRVMRSPPEQALRYAAAVTASASGITVLMIELSGIMLGRV